MTQEALLAYAHVPAILKLVLFVAVIPLASVFLSRGYWH